MRAEEDLNNTTRGQLQERAQAVLHAHRTRLRGTDTAVASAGPGGTGGGGAVWTADAVPAPPAGSSSSSSARGGRKARVGGCAAGEGGGDGSEVGAAAGAEGAIPLHPKDTALEECRRLGLAPAILFDQMRDLVSAPSAPRRRSLLTACHR